MGRAKATAFSNYWRTRYISNPVPTTEDKIESMFKLFGMENIDLEEYKKLRHLFNNRSKENWEKILDSRFPEPIRKNLAHFRNIELTAVSEGFDLSASSLHGLTLLGASEIDVQVDSVDWLDINGHYIREINSLSEELGDDITKWNQDLIASEYVEEYNKTLSLIANREMMDNLTEIASGFAVEATHPGSMGLKTFYIKTAKVYVAKTIRSDPGRGYRKEYQLLSDKINSQLKTVLLPAVAQINPEYIL